LKSSHIASLCIAGVMWRKIFQNSRKGKVRSQTRPRLLLADPQGKDEQIVRRRRRAFFKLPEQRKKVGGRKAAAYGGGDKEFSGEKDGFALKVLDLTVGMIQQ